MNASSRPLLMICFYVEKLRTTDRHNGMGLDSTAAPSFPKYFCSEIPEVQES